MKHLTLLAGLAVCGSALASGFVQESARQIPLVKETDVLVVGGSSGAVTAALAAATFDTSVTLPKNLKPHVNVGATSCVLTVTADGTIVIFR